MTAESLSSILTMMRYTVEEWGQNVACDEFPHISMAQPAHHQSDALRQKLTTLRLFAEALPSLLCRLTLSLSGQVLLLVFLTASLGEL